MVLGGCGLFGVLAAQEADPVKSRRPNVLFLISDDLRNELGCYGSELAKTPNLDRLAAEGVRFDRAYCQFPLCNPSRASMLTGRHPGSTGVIGNRTWYGTEHPGMVSLPKYFRDSGYLTLRAGKIFHGGMDEADAWDEGGEARYFGAGAPGRPPRTGRPETRDGRPLSKAERSDRWIVLEGEAEKGGDHRVADRTIDFLREHRDETFFLACGFSKPHSPLAAPKRFFDLWDVDEIPLPEDFASRPTVPEGFPAGSIRPRNADLFIGRDASPEQAREMIRAYLASSAWMDWNVGRVLDELEQLGLEENTIIVFWGDHGYQLGEKGKWSKAGSLWEQGIRVPMFIVDPRAAGNGKASPRVVESIDLYPTLVDLCGLPALEALEGRSLRPLLEDPEAAWDHPAFSVWSEDGEHFTGVSLRTERWHFAEFFGRGAGIMLTEPDKDPGEVVNLAGEPGQAERVAEFSRMVREYAEGHLPQ